MIRVLLVDDLRLLGRLNRLIETRRVAWDVVIAPDEQHSLWTPLLENQPIRLLTPAQVARAGLLAQPATIVVAATSSTLLKVASDWAKVPGTRLLVLPHVKQGADWAFSLFPLGEGDQPQVVTVTDVATNEAVQDFRKLIESGQLANRSVARASEESSAEAMQPTYGCLRQWAGGAFTQADLEECLFDDLPLLKHLAGEFDSLFAVTVPASEGPFQNVTVTLRGANAGTVVWTLKVGDEKKWEFWSEQRSDRRLVRNPDGDFVISGVQPRETDFVSSGRTDPETGLPVTDWTAVLRAFDDISALRRSVSRERKVPLQKEFASEQAQFKSLMTANGCGLILATLFGTVCLLAVGTAFDPRSSLQKNSERAGLVLRDDDFIAGRKDLAELSRLEFAGLVRRLGQTSAPVLIEETQDQELDVERKKAVQGLLEKAGITGAEARVEIMPLKGELFLNVLKGLWILLFLPLGGFLVLQVFLLVVPRAVQPEPDRE